MMTYQRTFAQTTQQSRSGLIKIDDNVSIRNAQRPFERLFRLGGVGRQ